jgi:thiopeptide-type bacteriocin biosynthesis protein
MNEAGPIRLEPLEWGVVRAPLLPIDAYPADRAGEARLWDDPRFRVALAVATPSLCAAVDRSPISERERARVRGKLLRYMIRATTRPTPFGMFAGVGLVTWGPRTAIALADEPRTRTRADMGWLMALVTRLERDPAVRRALRLFANQRAFERGGRVFLDGVDVRATAPVRRILALTRTPIGYGELERALLELPGATPEKVRELIDELWSRSLLLTDLRPPLTDPAPARYVRDRLEGIEAARPVREALDDLLGAFDRFDRLAVRRRLGAWRDVADRGARLRAGATCAQVDMALSLAGAQIGARVAHEAARAAELLVRLGPEPAESSMLGAYRGRFEARYGPSREVPLLELLDPDFGLGPPAEPERPVPRDPERAIARSRVLSELALGALDARQLVVELDDELMARLETHADDAVRTLELSVFVATRSVEDLDAGRFMLVVGPNLGADVAGRGLGRFADLLGPRALAALRDGVVGEDHGELVAELVYMPADHRLANVAVRPPVAEHEVVCETTPGEARTIPLQGVLVGVRDGRFYARWQEVDRDLALCESHMLNRRRAPAPVRFLIDLQMDGRAALAPFDWGPAAGFPFLPRVQRGRIVLAAARWRIAKLPAGVAEFGAALQAERRRWRLPRHVYLGHGDQRLLVDLDRPAHVELLREEARAARDLVLHEALPGHDDGWLAGPDGGHVVELTVPLKSVAVDGRALRARARVAAPARARTRLAMPGSRWLYLKLYCAPALQDDLIGHELRRLAREAEGAGLASAWFFVRYADPDAHLRVRFRGEPSTLMQRLFPLLCDWATELVLRDRATRFGFDTYEREIELYGGERGAGFAEELFCADSRCAADLLGVAHGAEGFDATALAVAGVDRLLADLGLAAGERAGWYASRTTLSAQDGKAFRRRRSRLLAAEQGPEVARILAERSRALSRVAEPLAAQDQAVPLERFVHLHCNRMLANARTQEPDVLRLARRTLEAARHASARGSAVPRAFGP